MKAFATGGSIFFSTLIERCLRCTQWNTPVEEGVASFARCKLNKAFSGVLCYEEERADTIETADFQYAAINIHLL